MSYYAQLPLIQFPTVILKSWHCTVHKLIMPPTLCNYKSTWYVLSYLTVMIYMRHNCTPSPFMLHIAIKIYVAYMSQFMFYKHWALFLVCYTIWSCLNSTVVKEFMASKLVLKILFSVKFATSIFHPATNKFLTFWQWSKCKQPDIIITLWRRVAWVSFCWVPKIASWLCEHHRINTCGQDNYAKLPVNNCLQLATILQNAYHSSKIVFSSTEILFSYLMADENCGWRHKQFCSVVKCAMGQIDVICVGLGFDIQCIIVHQPRPQDL